MAGSNSGDRSCKPSEGTHRKAGEDIVFGEPARAAAAFDNEWLAAGNDGARFALPPGRVVMATDSHVVSPLFFPGGDIGTLSVGSVPRQGVIGQDDDDDIVQGIVLMQRGAQSMPTIKAVQKEVADINASGILPPGVKIDIAGFGDPDRFAREAERLGTAIAGLARAEGVSKIMLPGERGDTIRAEREANELNSMTELGKSLSKITVVIADDQTLFREGIKDLLEDEKGIEVIAEAADGQEALKLVKPVVIAEFEALAQLRPDIIVLAEPEPTTIVEPAMSMASVPCWLR